MVFGQLRHDEMASLTEVPLPPVASRIQGAGAVNSHLGAGARYSRGNAFSLAERILPAGLVAGRTHFPARSGALYWIVRSFVVVPAPDPAAPAGSGCKTELAQLTRFRRAVLRAQLRCYIERGQRLQRNLWVGLENGADQRRGGGEPGKRSPSEIGW